MLYLLYLKDKSIIKVEASYKNMDNMDKKKFIVCIFIDKINFMS